MYVTVCVNLKYHLAYEQFNSHNMDPPTQHGPTYKTWTRLHNMDPPTV